MRVLALDSATDVAAAAVVEDNNLVAEQFINTGKMHSRRLMLLVEKLLNSSELTLSEIDGMAVAIGPGSFTGLRIGLSTIKGLAYFAEKPVVGISTLDSLARNVPFASGLICPVLKARKDEVYCALYLNSAGELVRISEYMAVSPQELVVLFERIDTRGIVLLGDALEMLPGQVYELLGGGYETAPPESRLPRASALGFLALDKFYRGEADRIETLTPIYIRASAAEERRHKE